MSEMYIHRLCCGDMFWKWCHKSRAETIWNLYYFRRLRGVR